MKFTIVTPSYNMAPWIRQTMDSILLQEGNFEIEYIVVDSGSTDGTAEILTEYVKIIQDRAYPIACKGVSMRVITTKPDGMYAAINRGFAEASGDVLAWLNADDIYAPRTFATIAHAFEKFPEMHWVKGVTDTVDESGNLIRIGRAHAYNQDWIARGVYGRDAYYIEQDSVFWRHSLWEKIGEIPAHYRLAGDYWLWTQFAKYAPLVTINEHVSFFRKRAGQLSKSYRAYHKERNDISPYMSATFPIRLFFSVRSRLTRPFQKLDALFIKVYPLLFQRARGTYIEPREEYAMKEMRSFIV